MEKGKCQKGKKFEVTSGNTKMYKTTAFTFTPKWDVYLYKNYACFHLKRSVINKLKEEYAEESAKFLDFYDTMPSKLKIHKNLMRAFAVVAVSFYDPSLQTRKAQNFVHAAWGMILRADPSFTEEEYFRKCGKMARTFPSSAAWRRYSLNKDQKDRQNLLDAFRRFYSVFDWGSPGAITYDVDRVAWKLKYIDGQTFEDISKHFNYRSKATIKCRFYKYYDKVTEFLKAGEFDTEPELLLLPIEHEVQLRESTYFTFPFLKNGFNAAKQQWYCCYACLDWSLDQIAEEWMVNVSEVSDFINWMDTVGRTRLLSQGKIPIVTAPRELTIKERLPHTPKQEMKSRENEDLINKLLEND